MTVNRAKHILVVSPVPVFPCTQGNRQVIRQLLNWFESNSFRVTLVLQVPKLCATERIRYSDVCDSLIISGDFMREPSLKKRLLSAAKCKILRFFKLNVKSSKMQVFCCNAETISVVCQLTETVSFDAVIVQYNYMTPVFEFVKGGVIKMVQTHDAWSLIEKNIVSKGGNSQGRELSREEEALSLQAADIIIAITNEEANYFRGLLLGKKVITVGFAVDDGDICEPDPQRSATHKILFIGSANPLNLRGIEWFIENCWHQLQEMWPEVNLVVCGSVCDAITLQGKTNIRLLGCVDDLDQFWRKADVFINPVDLGTGLKIKTIEALKYGKAIVATPEAVSGIEYQSDAPFLIAEDPDEFSRKVFELLSDTTLRHEYEQRAYSFAVNSLNLDTVYRELAVCI